jgi:hypothetical protein
MGQGDLGKRGDREVPSRCRLRVCLKELDGEGRTQRPGGSKGIPGRCSKPTARVEGRLPGGVEGPRPRTPGWVYGFSNMELKVTMGADLGVKAILGIQR